MIQVLIPYSMQTDDLGNGKRMGVSEYLWTINATPCGEGINPFTTGLFITHPRETVTALFRAVTKAKSLPILHVIPNVAATAFCVRPSAKVLFMAQPFPPSSIAQKLKSAFRVAE
jgi:hypothetical protein